MKLHGEQMQLQELKTFIKQNAPYIVEYINCEVLKEIGTMNPNYFVKLVNDSFVKQTSVQKIDPNLLPYYLFTQIEAKGRMDYTSLRTETISLNKLNDEAKVYYNYARFTLNKDFFIIDLMQTKIGGMPIDEDIVKFSKQVPISDLGLEEFIWKNRDTAMNATLKRIQEEIEKIL
jgi:hypothetical protein